MSKHDFDFERLVMDYRAEMLRKQEKKALIGVACENGYIKLTLSSSDNRVITKVMNPTEAIHLAQRLLREAVPLLPR